MKKSPDRDLNSGSLHYWTIKDFQTENQDFMYQCSAIPLGHRGNNRVGTLFLF